eukprot:347947-Chlamydomonas_euryale.AAC.8
MSQKKRERCLQEVKLLSKLSHPNIIQMLDAFIDDNQLIIIFEWAPAGGRSGSCMHGCMCVRDNAHVDALRKQDGGLRMHLVPACTTCACAWQSTNMHACVPAGDLKRLIKKTAEAKKTLDEPSIWMFFAQITDALLYMHQQRIMHRQVKCAPGAGAHRHPQETTEGSASWAACPRRRRRRAAKLFVLPSAGHRVAALPHAAAS